MMNRREKGITLVALVVTIIVLIILATISIQTVFSDDGIIKQTEKAKEMQANAEAQVREGLDAYEEFVRDESL